MITDIILDRILHTAEADQSAVVVNVATELKDLRAAVRAHRDARGDDRCWMDDEELYRALPEGYAPPIRDTRVELALCQQYIACRQNPATEYVSPQRRIEELEAALSAERMTHPDLIRSTLDAQNVTLSAENRKLRELLDYITKDRNYWRMRALKNVSIE